MKRTPGPPCTETWQAFRGDVLRGLLGVDSANFRWRVLRDLVGRPDDSPAVVKAQSAANIESPVAALLAELHPDGRWAVEGRRWRPRVDPVTRLTAAVHWGCDPRDPRGRAGARRLLDELPGEGGFAPSPGSPPHPCFTGRVLELTAAFGLAGDLRYEEAAAWLQEETEPVGWCCRKGARPGAAGCAATAVAVLSATSSSAAPRRSGLCERAVGVLIDVLERPGASSSLARWGHANLLRSDAAEILSVMARAGIDYDPRMRAALVALQGAQDADGWWRLRHPSARSLPEEARNGELVGGISPWVTLRAATALMRYAVAAELPRLFPVRP